MNYAVIGRILSWVLRTEGLLMLLPCLIALIYGEWQGLVYLALGVGAIAAGWLLSRKRLPIPPSISAKALCPLGFLGLSFPFMEQFPLSLPVRFRFFLMPFLRLCQGLRRQVLPYWPMWRRSLIQACFGGAFPTGLAGWASWSSFS